MYLHTFENGYCTTCGEDFDYFADNVLRDRAIIGPMLPINENQGTLPLAMAVMA